MRSIQVSTDVFAAIWASRLAGEDTEDAILRRHFSVENSKKCAAASFSTPIGVGWFDEKYKVVLEPGFEITRTYLNKPYRAQAIGGVWILNTTGKGYTTLNKLSTAIGIKKEDAWKNWFYMDGGKRHPIHDKRDPTTVSSRTTLSLITEYSAEELGL